MSRWNRVSRVWRRVLGLSWPVMVEQTSRTMMRTVDIVVTGLFAPAAIAAIGIADVYARIPLWLGLGVGGGAIALSSQDTGSGATANRDEAITQALLLGVLLGVPFVLLGLAFGRSAIAVLGASEEVAALGGTYLAVVLATAPARHVAIIASRALQGTGDTRTPMVINIGANLLNIVGSLVVGLGLFGAPRLGILGVGAATAVANVLGAGAFLAAIASPRTTPNFARPTSPVIARQLLRVSTPRIAEGLVTLAAEFPLNAILLGFGTEVNAAYQVGRRLYQQATAPLARSYNVAAGILVGQALGDEDARAARFEGWAVAALGVVTVGALGAVLYVGAGPLADLFTDDAATLTYAAEFTMVFGVAAPFLALFTALNGALQGASETRLPLLARVTGMFGFMVGLSYVSGVVLGHGVPGAYAGMLLTYVWMALFVAAAFRWTDWAGRAADMMAERGSIPGAPE